MTDNTHHASMNEIFLGRMHAVGSTLLTTIHSRFAGAGRIRHQAAALAQERAEIEIWILYAALHAGASSPRLGIAAGRAQPNVAAADPSQDGEDRNAMFTARSALMQEHVVLPKSSLPEFGHEGFEISGWRHGGDRISPPGGSTLPRLWKASLKRRSETE